MTIQELIDALEKLSAEHGSHIFVENHAGLLISSVEHADDDTGRNEWIEIK